MSRGIIPYQLSRNAMQILLKNLKEFEGLRLKAYQDDGGVWTIGYGDTDNVTPSMEITEVEAEARLQHQAERFLNGVYQLLAIPLPPHKIAALASLAYNIGLGAFGNSTLLRKVNTRASDDDVYVEFLRWQFIKGKASPGLLNRRKAEAALYIDGEGRA